MMNKWMKGLTLAALTLGVTLAVNVDADAAGKVSNVKQTYGNSSRFEISWDAVLGCNRYVIEVSEDQFNWVRMTDTGDTNATVYNLSAGKTYYTRVTGYTDWSWVSDTGTVYTDASDPIDVVTAPSISNMTVDQRDATTDSFTIEVKGDNISGANYFKTYISGQDVPVAESAEPVFSVQNNLTAGAEYSCNTYACRKSSSGFVAQGTGEGRRYKTLCGKLSNNAFGPTNIYHNINVYYFEVVSDLKADGYQLQFLNTKGKAKKTYTQAGKSFRISDNLDGTFYQYRVRAYVDCGNEKVYSKWSDCRYLGIVDKVTNASSSYKNSPLKINWSKVSGATKFVVQMSYNENSGYKKVATVKGSKRSVSIAKFKGKKITTGKRYYIKITAYSKVNGKTVKSDVIWTGNYYRY